MDRATLEEKPSKTEKLSYYPYRFRSILKEKVWGGRTLATALGKDLPPNTPIGETWEVSDRHEDVSVVDNGTHAGMTLRAMIEQDRKGILGAKHAEQFPHRFPLLIKYIDAEDILSLQVHPDDTYSMKNENGEWGKMEAWYIIHAEDGASIIRGTLPGVTRETFLKKLEDGTLDDVLNSITVRPGDVIYIPPGCLHATGAGIVMAEVQQNSDLTYRVYDWGRVGLDGKPRELHLNKAMDVIDWTLLEREAVNPPSVHSGRPGPAEKLLDCPKFEMERITLDAGESSPALMSDRFHVLCVIEGDGFIVSTKEGTERMHCRKGETYLLPAALGTYEITTTSSIVALRAHLPSAD